MNNIPRKTRNHVGNTADAITSTVQALADAKARGNGLNLETTFPEGRIRVVIGEINVTVGQPKPAQARPKS